MVQIKPPGRLSLFKAGQVTLHHAYRWICIGLGAGLWPTFALAQLPVAGSFESNGTEPGWVASGPAYLTSGSYDGPAAGWLRLTEAVGQSKSTILNEQQSFSAAQGLRIKFEFVIWGGGSPGGDGLSVFLYDATSNMAGAEGGGGLGYCKGAGAWLGLGLDAYGNFAQNGSCTGGPGFVPQAVVLRGPTAAGNPFVGGSTAPDRLSYDSEKQRPEPQEVTLEISPKEPHLGPGYSVNLVIKNLKTGKSTNLLKQSDFPYVAPANLHIGLAASTGGAKNIHEVRRLTVSALSTTTPSSVTLEQSFQPPAIAKGKTTQLTLGFKSATGRAIVLTRTYVHRLPKGLLVAKPLALGGSCPGTVVAQPGGSTIELASGFTVRPSGCTVTVSISASEPGQFVSTIEASQLQFEGGANGSPSSAKLVVNPN